MESIEVWMWLIVGLIIAGSLFVGGMAVFANYTRDLEVDDSMNNFASLNNQIKRVCLGGLNNEASENKILSYYVEEIWVENTQQLEGFGKNICIKIKDEDVVCNDLEICDVKMQSIEVNDKTNVFYLIQKALGKKKVAKVNFDIEKTNYSLVNVTWQREYVK